MRLLYCAFVSALALVVNSPSLASDWPTRTIRIIVPFGPGGPGMCSAGSLPTICERFKAESCR